jgi:hypothetical protein
MSVGLGHHIVQQPQHAAHMIDDHGQHAPAREVHNRT